MFKVCDGQCSTCIYKPGLGWRVEELEQQIDDGHGGFNGYRECHHSPEGTPLCCRGFWDRHKNKFALGQIAQRMGAVQYVEPSPDVTG